jgi:transposase
MKITTPVLKGFLRLKLAPELTKEAGKRLKWFNYYQSRKGNARLTCRYFGISPQTFYRWKRRYDPKHLETLEDRSHRPRRVRQPTYSVELVRVVISLRERYPRWGKDKLVILLEEEGYHVSASTVGRILSYLKRRGILKEPIPNHVSARKRLRKRPYATRKPKEYEARQGGDIVQLDTLDLRPLPGRSCPQALHGP